MKLEDDLIPDLEPFKNMIGKQVEVINWIDSSWLQVWNMSTSVPVPNLSRGFPSRWCVWSSTEL